MMANRLPGPASVPKTLLRVSAVSVHVGSRKPGERERHCGRGRGGGIKETLTQTETRSRLFPRWLGRIHGLSDRNIYRAIAVLPSGEASKRAYCNVDGIIYRIVIYKRFLIKSHVNNK